MRTSYNAVIVPDKEPGIRLLHLFVEPPVDEETARAIEAGTGAGLSQAENDDGMSKFVINPRSVQISNLRQVSMEKFEAVMDELGHNCQPFNGLKENPTWTEFRVFLARRDPHYSRY